MRSLRLTMLAIAFGLGSVFSNRGHGELGAYLKDQRNERTTDDDPMRDPLVIEVDGEARKILL